MMSDARGGASGETGRVAPRVFRAASGPVSLGAAAIITALLIVDAIVRAGWLETFLLLPWLLLVLWGIYVATFASHVAIDAEGITVQNLLRVIRIPWGCVHDIGMRFQLRVTVDDSSVVNAFGGPAAGRPPRPARRSEPDAPRRESTAVRDLQLIREQWDAAASAGASGGDVVRRWDLRSLLALGVLACWALGAVIISRSIG